MAWTRNWVAPSWEPEDRKAWRPNMIPGFFYVGEEQHYLYAQKGSSTLSERTWYKLSLPVAPADGVVSSVSLNSVVLPVGEYYVEGDFLWVRGQLYPDSYLTAMNTLVYGSSNWGYSAGVYADPDGASVEVSYTALQWSPASQAFIYNSLTINRVLGNAVDRRYYLPTTADPWSPVVITDDFIEGDEVRPYAMAFRVDSELTPGRGYEIELYESDLNILKNPSFTWVEAHTSGPNSYITKGSWRIPYNWHVGSEVYRDDSTPSFYGNSRCVIESTGLLSQEIDSVDAESLTLSVWVRSRRTESNTGVIGGLSFGLGFVADNITTTTYIDDVGATTSTASILNTTIPVSRTVYHTGTEVARYDIHLGTQLEPYPIVSAGIPRFSDKIHIKCVGVTGVAEIVATSLTTTPYPVDFNYTNPLATVEWENAGGSMWKWRPLDEAPYAVNDVDLMRRNEDTSASFVSLYPGIEGIDYKLGLGGPRFESSAPGFVVIEDPTIVGAMPSGFDDYGDTFEVWWSTFAQAESDAAATTNKYAVWSVYQGSILDPGYWPSPPSYIAPGSLWWTFSPSSGLDWTSYKGYLPTYAASQLPSILTNTGVHGICFSDLGALADTLKGYVTPGTENQEVLELMEDIRTAVSSSGLDEVSYALRNPWEAWTTDAYYDWSDVHHITIDGLSRDSNLVERSYLDRFQYLNRGEEVVSRLNTIPNSSVLVYAIDYEDPYPDTLVTEMPDYVGRLRHRDFAVRFGCADHTQTEPNKNTVLTQYRTSYFSPLGIVNPIYPIPETTDPTSATPTEVFGRSHIPYAVTRGANKWARRGILGTGLEPHSNPPWVIGAGIPSAPASLSLLPVDQSYRDAGGDVVLLSTHKHSVEVLLTVVDANGNPCCGYPVNLQADHGTLSSSYIYTDRNGIGRFTFTANVSFVTDTIVALSHYGYVLDTLQVERSF